MFRKLFLVIAPVLFLSGIAIQIYCLAALIANSPLVSISAVLWMTGILWMLVMAAIYGSLHKVMWALITTLLLILIMTASLFARIMHWADVSLWAMGLSALLAIVYLIHFFMKKVKKFIDVSKLLFVISSLCVYLTTMLGSNYIGGIMVSWVILLVVLFITVWIYVYRFKETTEHPEIAENGNNLFNYTNDETSGSIQ